MVYEIKLKGGLCNKLFCLFSGVEVAIKDKEKLLEPNFGLTNEILFSDIYDIDFFNENMRKYTGLKDFMVPKKIYNSSNSLIVKKVIDGNKLWNMSEKNLKKQRNANMMKTNCMNIVVLKSLRLNSENLKLVNLIKNIEKKNAIHIRIENDWIQYSKTKKVIKNETLLIKLETLINIYKEKWNNSELFFTTGENHYIILEKFKQEKIENGYFFKENQDYEINAAINFELCLRSKNFVGLSRSTFSNLVTLKRCLNCKENNYIYNYKGQILLRLDMGLHPNPKNCIKNKVILDHNHEYDFNFVLNNSNKFPAIGLGIGNMQKDRIPDVIKNATLIHGIKLVDTNQRAAITCNTDTVLQNNPGLQVVTKVRYTHLGYERTILAVEDMLKGLNGCCEVTMLIHWPRCRDSWKERCKKEEENLPQRIKDAGPPPIEDYFAWKGSWKALEEFYINGKLKNIGISNFDINDLNELLSFCKVVPQLYQGNAWQLWFRPKIIDLLKSKNILFQAYNVVDGIVNRKREAPNAYKALTNIAKSKNADLCTIVLATLNKMGIATIPRASSPNHLEANAPQTVYSLNINDNEAQTLDYVMKALMCGKDLERELRVFVTFSCSNESYIKIYWKNSETGKEVLQGTINNNKCLRISTNNGHIFNAYSEKNLLNSFIVTANVGQKEEFFIT